MRQVNQQLAELYLLMRGNSSPQSPPRRKRNGYKEVQARGPAVYPTPSPEDTFGSQGGMHFDPGDEAARRQQSRFSGLYNDSSDDENGSSKIRDSGQTRNLTEAGDAGSGAARETYDTPKETAFIPQPSVEKREPPAPPAQQTQTQTPSKIPTPKQSMKNLVHKQPSSGSVAGTGSSASTSGGSGRNRFGFLGGKKK